LLRGALLTINGIAAGMRNTAEKRADLEQGEKGDSLCCNLLKQKRVLICTFVAMASGIFSSYVGGQMSMKAHIYKCQTQPWNENGITPGLYRGLFGKAAQQGYGGWIWGVCQWLGNAQDI